MRENEILQIYGTAYKENTVKLLEEADLAGLIPSRDARIAIKPNLVSATEASYGATTHPELVEGIIIYLKENGFGNLVIMEGSWVGGRTSDAFDICGYRALSETYDVPLIDLQKEKWVSRDCAGMELKICRPVTEIDFLINVPVLKGHCQTRITCALKNLKGLIPNQEKRRFHSLGLHKPIAHLAAGIRQDFILVDHICGDLDFEDGGNPVVRNGIFAGRDPVLMDALVCRMLHYDVSDVPYVGLAGKLGVGSSDLEKALIRVIQAENMNRGREITGKPGGGSSGHEKDSMREAPTGAVREQSLLQETLPIPKKAVLVEDNVEEVDSCSACYGRLIPVLSRLKEEGSLNQLSDKICIGQGFRGKKGRIGVGNCTCFFDLYVPGCPPEEEDIYKALKAL